MLEGSQMTKEVIQFNKQDQNKDQSHWEKAIYTKELKDQDWKGKDLQEQSENLVTEHGCTGLIWFLGKTPLKWFLFYLVWMSFLLCLLFQGEFEVSCPLYRLVQWKGLSLSGKQESKNQLPSALLYMSQLRVPDQDPSIQIRQTQSRQRDLDLNQEFSTPLSCATQQEMSSGASDQSFICCSLQLVLPFELLPPHPYLCSPWENCL